MSSKIAVQLYSLRDKLAHDFSGTVQVLASLGYSGVEFAGCPNGLSFAQCRKILTNAGLQITSAHMPVPSGPNRNLIFDNVNLLNCRYLVTGKWVDDFKTIDAIKKSCDEFNFAAEEAEKNSLRLVIHNHWAEFELVDEVPAYKVMLEYLNPEILFEVDTYWVKVAGQNPAAVLAEMGSRAPLIHIKDGSGLPGDFSMKAVGQGVMDFKPIFTQATSADWLIVELDSCETNMLLAIKESYDYIVRNTGA